MNANELADALFTVENYYTEPQDEVLISHAATMLRQQQNEIEDLKSANRFIQNFAEEQHKRAVALEMRELTDEEIEEVFDREVGLNSACGWEKDFARAILRKAQEK